MRAIAEAFRASFAEALHTHLPAEPSLASFIEELEAIDCAAPRAPSAAPPPPTVTEHLEAALNGMEGGHPLAAAVRDLAGVAHWYQIFQGDDIEPKLAKGLVAAQMAGQVGLVSSSSIRTGLFLLAPGIHYPLHQHGALEIYFVVSGELTLQHGRSGRQFPVGPGQWSVTPCHQVHALTTHGDPCLLIYAWVGDIEAPNWWWEQDDQGAWHRHCWRRQSDARWLRTGSEPITEEILREAGEV